VVIPPGRCRQWEKMTCDVIWVESKMERRSSGKGEPTPLDTHNLPHWPVPGPWAAQRSSSAKCGGERRREVWVRGQGRGR